MPRALVDILRHQSSPVQQGERNNSTVLTTATSSEGTQGRTSKNFYTPVLQSKDNRTGKHSFGQTGSSPKHTATIDDTTVVGLISGGDDTAYRDEVEWMTVWCGENNLLLNTSKTKEVIIDFRRKKTDISQLYISGDWVDRVSDFCFLGVHIEEDLNWGE